MFTKRISHVWDQSGNGLIDLKLEACCNPNRFFEGADIFYDFANIDNSFGEPHSNPNVAGLAERAATRQQESLLDGAPTKRPRTMDTTNFNVGTSFEKEPRRRLVRLKSKGNRNTKRSVGRSRFNVQRFFDSDVAVGLGEGECDEMEGKFHQNNESDDDLDGDSDDTESSSERIKRAGLGNNFKSSKRRIEKGIFDDAAVAARAEENFALPLSSRISNLLRLCMTALIANNDPIEITPFDIKKLENHVPCEWSREHCDSIDPDESKRIFKGLYSTVFIVFSFCMYNI